MAMMHGGRLVAEALARHGVTHLFTLCGGHIQAIYDGCLDVGIRVVDVRHEQTAGHAADGMARATGRPGVVAVTAGPGVTDVVTALANAQRAGVPIVCIGGAGPVPLADRGSLQDMNHLDLVKAVVKASYRVTDTSRLAEYVGIAFRVAQAGVPGPVYLEMPLDVLMNYAELGELPEAPRYLPAGPAADGLARAVELLAGAARPMAIVGSQLLWSPATGALHALLERFAMPTFLNGMARTALGADHPCKLTTVRKQALAQADVVLVCGTPFDFRIDYGRAPTFPAAAKVIQVDRDGAVLGHNRAVTVGLTADTGLTLAALAAALPARAPDAWLAAMRETENKKAATMRAEMETVSDPPGPLHVCHVLGRYVDDDTVVIGDGGDFVATAAYALRLGAKGLWMDPGPLGTLGVGPGYAMAAKLARPNAKVIAVYGDGAFGLHAMELEAMARQKIPVVCVIGNDAGWTQIRRGQVQIYGEQRAVATALAYTRYDEVAKALGCFGAWVERAADLAPALDAAFAAAARDQVPAVVNVKIGSSDFRKGALSV